MKELHLNAYAKVNLALDVLRKRADGYHDVKMIMQNLDLYDELNFVVNDSDEMIIRITANRDDIPTDERNLIYKAIKLMCETYGLVGDIHVDLIKNIPVEAGMAGGSTDCAAALKAMNELFELELSEDELMKLGVKLGADVPFCVMARTAISEGIGEILTPIEGLKNCVVLVAKPPISVSTKMVYTNLKIDEIDNHPDVDGMVAALENGDTDKVSELLGNVLENVTVNLYNEIEVIKNCMKDNGAMNAIMSGSGPTVFGLYKNLEQAEEAARVIREKKLSKEIFVTVPVN